MFFNAAGWVGRRERKTRRDDARRLHRIAVCPRAWAPLDRKEMARDPEKQPSRDCDDGERAKSSRVAAVRRA